MHFVKQNHKKKLPTESPIDGLLGEFVFSPFSLKLGIP